MLPPRQGSLEGPRRSSASATRPHSSDLSSGRMKGFDLAENLAKSTVPDPSQAKVNVRYSFHRL